MLSSSIPQKFGTAFASGAGVGFIQYPIPDPSQTGANAGRASNTDGFPPETFQPLASGGNPPWGADMNGLMKQVTLWLQWAAAGGVPVAYDASFSTKINGYPLGAFLQNATLKDRYWISTVENNVTDPDSVSASGWRAFPDVIVQKQAGNYAQDIGSVNAFRVTLSPLPASLASIVGSPIRVKAANANTSTTPTILIDNVAGNGAVPIINGNGSALQVGQIARANQIFEGFLDGLGNFQLAWPPPLPSVPSQQQWAPGEIIIWSSEIPPLGTLECNGAQYPIASYPNLYNVIQNRYNSTGDGVNTFNVPDLRGAFIRGWDHGRGLDPSATTRTKLYNAGGTVGDHVGGWELQGIGTASFTGPIYLEHCFGAVLDLADWLNPLNNVRYSIGGMSISIPAPEITSSFTTASFATVGFTDVQFKNHQGNWPNPFPSSLIVADATFTGSGGPETRPVNMAAMYCIAY